MSIYGGVLSVVLEGAHGLGGLGYLMVDVVVIAEIVGDMVAKREGGGGGFGRREDGFLKKPGRWEK